MSEQPDRALPQSAFDELARIVVADHSMESVMDVVAHLAQRLITGASEVSVTYVLDGVSSTIATTGQTALYLDERQYELGHGPCLDCIDAGSAIVIEDLATEQRWPEWSRQGRAQGMGSTLSVPVPVQRDIGVALNIYSAEPYAFDKAEISLATTFAGYAGVAVANMHLYEAQARVSQQLQEAMTSRAVIEQAKGILMAVEHCTAEAAFDLLVAASQRENQKLREIATRIVENVQRIDPP